jgi:protein SCO1/2
MEQPPRSPVPAVVAFLLLAAGAAAVATQGGREPPPEPPGVFGEIPAFSLSERGGGTVTRDALLGRVWIADFIFTSCAGICPEMSRSMARIHEATRQDPGTLCVTFTVDPERDTPAVLREYAARYGASPDRWLFLRGPQDEVNRLENGGFLMGTVGSPLGHSPRFVLVDRRGRHRGWYDGTAPDGVAALLAAWRIVRGEPAGGDR